MDTAILAGDTFTDDYGGIVDTSGSAPISAGTPTDSSTYATYGPSLPANYDPTTSVTGASPLAAIPSTQSAYGQSGQAQGTLYNPTTGQVVPASSVNAPQQSTWASVLGFLGVAASSTAAIVNSQKQTAAGSQRTLATTKSATQLSSTTILVLGVGVLALVILMGRKS